MKSYSKLFVTLFLLFLSFVFVGCNNEQPKDDNNPENGDKIITFLDIEAISEIKKGDKITLKISYDQGAKVDITWASSDETIAIINEGVLTALKAGKTTITATDSISKLSKSIEVIVKDVINKEAIDEFVESLPKQTNNNLPNKCGELDVKYEFSSHVNTNGEISRDEDNFEANGKVVIGDFSYDYKVVIIGEFVDDIADEFIKQFKNINDDLNIKRTYDDYGGTTVIWNTESSILSNKGEFTRPFNNTTIVINYTVITKNPAAKATYSTEVVALGESIETKNKMIEEWINTVVKENSVLYVDSYLPEYCDEYETKIEWLDIDGEKVSLNKFADDPVLGKTAVFTVRVTYPDSKGYQTFTMDYRVWNKRYNSTKEKAEDFVNAIYKERIRSYVYWSQGYDEVNMGYVPFYDSNDSVINKDYMCEYTYGYVCTGILKKSTEYICVHDTAGAAPTHTALQFAQGQVQKNTNKSNTEYISWHFTVGNDGIYQSLPLDEVGYHAGDGSREYGTIWYSSTYNKADCIGGGNRNSVGIESCINHGSDYNDTMRILAKLVAELLLHYNLSVDRVKQHWHFSGKDCPGVIRHCNRWEEFLDLVRLEYFAKTELDGVSFEWTSLSPDILDNTGHVLKNDGKQFDISYKVKCTVDGESFEKEYTSTILEQYQIKLGDWN